jgi:hypothetical protein
MRTVTNDVPQVLLDVARDAMKLGMTEVTLGFMYLGADFPSPTEWALHLVKRENSFDAVAGTPAAPRVHVVLTMQRGEDTPTAYVGGLNDGPYWDVERVTAWMHESIDADGEYIRAWAPVTDETMQAHLLATWEPFREGVLSGWTMKHKVLWANLVYVEKLMGRAAALLEQLPLTSLEWHMTNTYYNEEKHPSYRGGDGDRSDVPVSISGYSFHRAHGVDEDCADREGGSFRSLQASPYQAVISADERREILQTTAPWFVRVAGYNDEEEYWTHFPESRDWKTSAEGAARAIADMQRALALGKAPVTA